MDLWTAALQEYQTADHAAPDFTAGREGDAAEHRRVRDHLYFSMWDVAEALGGEALGRDMVMRLGGGGFTPDTEGLSGPSSHGCRLRFRQRQILSGTIEQGPRRIGRHLRMDAPSRLYRQF